MATQAFAHITKISRASKSSLKLFEQLINNIVINEIASNRLSD